MKLFSIVGLLACVCLTLAVTAAAPLAIPTIAALATERIAAVFEQTPTIDLVAGLIAVALIAGASVAAVFSVIAQARRAELSIGSSPGRSPAFARASPDRPLTPT